MASGVEGAPAPRHLTAEEATRLDQKLMADVNQGGYGYMLEQLMEMAGLAVADAVEDSYGREGRCAIVAGPGNNGGDGFVCARHLLQRGWEVVVLAPKLKRQRPFDVLAEQCQSQGVEVIMGKESLTPDFLSRFDVVVDAVFGFSFSGEPREPFRSALTAMANCRRGIVAVDAPSGWDMEQGDVHGFGMWPNVLVSLSAPKVCARRLEGSARHYLGGRFIPPRLASEFDLSLPDASHPSRVGSQVFRLSH